MKTEVYSWRVSTDLKMDLERDARRRGTSLSAILDRAAREWLKRDSADNGDADEQRRLHRAAQNCFGAIASGDARRSENVRQIVRERLRQKRER